MHKMKKEASKKVLYGSGRNLKKVQNTFWELTAQKASAQMEIIHAYKL